MDLFFNFCNICYKTGDVSLKNISEENMKHLKDTLITFVGHADIIKCNEIYLCKLCCEELIRFDKFREMCFNHLIQLRQQYFNMLSELEMDDSAAAKNTLKKFVHEKVLRRNSGEKNSCPVSISTEYEVKKECELYVDCGDVSVIKSIIECDESRVAFTNEEEMEQEMIRPSEDTKREIIERKSDEDFHGFDVNNGNESNISQIEFTKKEFDLNDEIKRIDSDHFTLQNFKSELDEPVNLDSEMPVVNNSEDSLHTAIVIKEELHVKQENSTSEGVEFADGINVTFEIANVCTIVNMEDGKNKDRSQENKAGMKLGSRGYINEHISNIGEDTNFSNETSNEESPAATNNYPCSSSICNEKFTQEHTLTKHTLAHTAPRPYKCTLCNNSYTGFSGLTRHIRSHKNDKPSICSVCNKIFSNKIDLKLHKHSHERAHICTICNKSYIRLQHLREHLRVHSGERPFKCDICDKEFVYKNNLVKHGLTHSGVRRYACSVCGKKFLCKTAVTRHERIHTGARPYICTVCQKSFLDASCLSRHKIVHNEKMYICTVCKKSFTCSKTLLAHERIHKREYSYKCDVCNKGFPDRTALSRHERVHSGDRPFMCHVCNKTFTQSGNLMKHEKLHNDERPYKCCVCNKSYKDRFYFNAHKKTHGKQTTLN